MANLVDDPEPAIKLRDFLAEYKNKLIDLYDSTTAGDSKPFYFAANSPVSADVEASCSLSYISSPEDNMINSFEPGAEIQRPSLYKPESSTQNLPQTHIVLNKHKDRTRKTAFERTQYSNRLVAIPPATVDREDCELEITVRFYRPPRASHRSYKVERPVFAEEFICLGSNYLTELRDKISCICNGKRFVDVSNDPEAPIQSLTTDPGYFFIHDTFYNDKRNPNNCDYSETVVQWAPKALGAQGKKFKVKNMESTRFIDLTVSLGTPLQYLHHGNCEHLFVFSQLEVLTPLSKSPDRSLYPYMRAFNNFNVRPCYMCGLRSFTFIVEKSRRQLVDPTYLCRSCFQKFHYIDGKKVDEFKAYRIYDHSEQTLDGNHCDQNEGEGERDADEFIID